MPSFRRGMPSWAAHRHARGNLLARYQRIHVDNGPVYEALG